MIMLVRTRCKTIYMVLKTSDDMGMIEGLGNNELNLQVVASLTVVFFLTPASRVLFGWEDTAKYQKRKHR